MKKCPYCAEEIQDEAVFCKYCKRDLPKTQPVVNNATVYSNTVQSYQVAKPKSNKKLVILVIVLAVLILLIGTLIIVPTLIGYSMKDGNVNSNGAGIYNLCGIDDLDFDNIPDNYKGIAGLDVESAYKEMSEKTYLLLFDDGSGALVTEIYFDGFSYDGYEITKWNDDSFTYKFLKVDFDDDYNIIKTPSNATVSYTRSENKITVEDFGGSGKKMTFKYTSYVSEKSLAGYLNNHKLILFDLRQ